MDWVDDNVSVGGWRDAITSSRLRNTGADFVVDARALFDQVLYGYRRVPIVDRILRTADLLATCSEKGPKIMIRCHHGRDRSPFVAMVYVSRKYDMNYRDAYVTVKQKVPRTVYHWDWVRLLEKG